MKLYKLIVLCMLSISSLIANDADIDLSTTDTEIISDPINSVDCIILKDENSIICKYIHQRSEEDKYVEFYWIDPMGNISRERTMLIPAGHGSIYDYRFINGRVSGQWTFKVQDNNQTYQTNFIIE